MTEKLTDETLVRLPRLPVVVPVLQSTYARAEVELWLEATTTGFVLTYHGHKRYSRSNRRSPWALSYRGPEAFSYTSAEAAVILRYVALTSSGVANADICPASGDTDPGSLREVMATLPEKLKMSRNEVGLAIDHPAGAALIYRMQQGQFRKVTEKHLEQLSGLVLDAGFPKLATYFMTDAKRALMQANRPKDKYERGEYKDIRF